MDIELNINPDTGIEDGHKVTIHEGVYICKVSSMFFHVELGFTSKRTPAVRVTGVSHEDTIVERIVEMNGDDEGLSLFVLLLSNSEYLGEL